MFIKRAELKALKDAAYKVAGLERHVETLEAVLTSVVKQLGGDAWVSDHSGLHITGVVPVAGVLADRTSRLEALEKTVNGEPAEPSSHVFFSLWGGKAGLAKTVERIDKALDRQGNDLSELIEAAGYAVKSTPAERKVVKKSAKKRA